MLSTMGPGILQMGVTLGTLSGIYKRKNERRQDYILPNEKNIILNPFTLITAIILLKVKGVL